MKFSIDLDKNTFSDGWMMGLEKVVREQMEMADVDSSFKELLQRGYKK